MMEELYVNEYVKSNCIDYEKGIGKIFYYDTIKNNLTSDVEINIALHNLENIDNDLYNNIMKQTYRIQNKLLEVPKGFLSNISKEAKEIHIDQTKAAQLYNNRMIELMMS